MGQCGTPSSFQHVVGIAEMKIEFRKSEHHSNLDLVFINEVFNGEFHADVAKASFLYVPVRGDRILLSRVPYEEARQLLQGELAHGH